MSRGSLTACSGERAKMFTQDWPQPGSISLTGPHSLPAGPVTAPPEAPVATSIRLPLWDAVKALSIQPGL